MVKTTTLKFRVIEKGQWAYIVWPWKAPEDFLYLALAWDAMYAIRMPLKPTRQMWVEFVAEAGTYGEYTRDLYFGHLDVLWGWCLYRRFNAGSSHYLTQHGLDGIPQRMQKAAYEYRPGEPAGDVLFQFRVETKQGAFDMTYYDWLHYFVSGRNEHISRMGISITKSK